MGGLPGQVPVLQLEDGSFLTEGAVISQFLVDQFERKDLLPEINTQSVIKHFLG